MKKLHLLGVAAMILTLASCGSNKQMVNNQPQQQQPTYQQPAQQPVAQQPVAQQPSRESVVIPCKQEARSDKDYFRELGVGTNVNMQNARDAALSSAKEMLKNRLGGVVKGVSTGYSKTVAGQSASDKVERIMEREMNQVVDKMLNDADNPCEDVIWLGSGEYQAYYVIEVSKKELIDNSIEVLSQEEELKYLYDRDKFREWVKQYMSENQ